MTQFRAPNPKVRAELMRLFEYVGMVNIADGEPMTIDDVFALLAERFGPEAAAACSVEITLH